MNTVSEAEIQRMIEVSRKLGVSVTDFRDLVVSWKSLHEGLFYRTAADTLRLASTTCLVAANDKVCDMKTGTPDENKNDRIYLYLLRARMILNGTENGAAVVSMPSLF